MEKFPHISAGFRHRSTLLRWAKLISVTSVAQILVQLLSFASGLLILSVLPSQEYAFYTLANSMLGMMTLLSDGGIGTGVMSQGGKVWREVDKLGMVIATGLKLRKRFSVISVIVATPILFVLLQRQGGSIFMCTAISLSLIPAYVTALSGSILSIVPKLCQDIAPLQRTQITTGLLRVLLVCVSLFKFPFAWMAIASSGLAQVYGNIQLRRQAGKHATLASHDDPIVRAEILKIVRRFMPTAVYFSFSSQISIWIISFTGNFQSTAQFGAITRITIMFGILTTVFGTLVTPRFARLKNDAPILIKKFVTAQSILFSCACLLYLTCFVFSSQILHVLGSRYANLDEEFNLQCAISLLTFVVGSLSSLNASRGFILHPLIHIPFNLVVIILLYYNFQPVALVDVLKMELIRSAIAPLVTNFVFFSHVRTQTSRR